MSWVRLWADMPTDPKWRVIAKRSGRPLSEVLAVFVFMLTNAGANATERGELQNWCSDDVAAGLDLEPEHVDAIYQAMQGKTLDGDKLTGWEKRQPKREDGSAERAKAWRERNRTQPNAAKRPDADSEADSDTDAEGKTDRQSLDAAREQKTSDGRSAAFGDLKRMFNGSTEAMIIFAEKAMGGHCRPNAEQWLASTVSAHGATFVAQAFAIMVEKQASGEIGARPLPQWSKIAAGLKTRQGAPNPHQSTGKPTVSELLRRQREQEAA